MSAAWLRDVSAGSGPIRRPRRSIAEQDRGFREFYLKAPCRASVGAHEWKAGADMSAGTVREQFGYQITDPRHVRRATRPRFHLRRPPRDREQALFVQDQMQLGAVDRECRTALGSLPAGGRRRRLQPAACGGLVVAGGVISCSGPRTTARSRRLRSRTCCSRARSESSAWTTRSSACRCRPRAATSTKRGSRRRLFGRVRDRRDAFSRRMSDVADDDLLLNTGVSFPIAFQRARHHGAEVKVDVPRTGRTVSGFAQLFVPARRGPAADDRRALSRRRRRRELESTSEFSHHPGSTTHGSADASSYSLLILGWIAIAGSFGSGLPFEDFDGTREDAVEQFGSAASSIG